MITGPLRMQTRVGTAAFMMAEVTGMASEMVQCGAQCTGCDTLHTCQVHTPEGLREAMCTKS